MTISDLHQHLLKLRADLRVHPGADQGRINLALVAALLRITDELQRSAPDAAVGSPDWSELLRGFGSGRGGS